MDMKTDEQSGAGKFEANKERARDWFETLRDTMLASLEAVEDSAEGLPGCEGMAAGRFTRKHH